MMNKILYFCLLVFLLSACKSVTTVQQQEPMCLGTELDGSQTVRSFGIGRNEIDARQQAKKNAVSAVIFTGIRSGVEGCNTKPIIFEVNAREKYEDFFNAFFADGGDYQKFVSYKDTRTASAQRSRTNAQFKISLALRIDRAGLKQYLIENNIIKK